MRNLGLITLALLFAACSGGGTAKLTVEKDVGAADGWADDKLGGPDSGPELAWPLDAPLEEAGSYDLAGDQGGFDLAPEPGEFGYPCDSDDECHSGFCVATPDGDVCTVLCDAECPLGWECALHKPSLPDQLYICVPGHLNLCRPCQTNSECEVYGTDSGQLCIAYGEGGNFCGGQCADNEDCPEGYQCDLAPGVSGQESMQCVLSAGECECADWFVDEMAVTECTVENEHGICAGVQNCSDGELTCDAAFPAPEACDGVDNNCAGVSNLGQEDFDQDGMGDVCDDDTDGDGDPNASDCAPFDPDVAAGVGEECDGIDNNCQLGVDEGFVDSDLDGFKDCVDMDDDNDGDPDVTDCEPLNPAVHAKADDVCNTVDNNCDGEVEEGCATSCQDWKDLDPDAPDGLYLIDVDGPGPALPFEAWCDMTIDGGGWTRFFWVDAAFPNNKDPFEFEVWECNNNNSHCRAGIPENVEPTDLLIVDKTDGAYAAWHFDPANNVSNAVLGALRDRNPVCLVNGQAFNPYTVSSAEQFCGTGLEGGCDSFYYTTGTCDGGKTVSGSWGVNWDGDSGCYSSAFKVGDVSTPCCGCVMNGSDWAFLNYTDVKDESGEIYYR